MHLPWHKVVEAFKRENSIECIEILLTDYSEFFHSDITLIRMAKMMFKASFFPPNT